MTGYCIDTDILVDFVEGKGAAREFLGREESRRQLYVSVLTVVELYAGIKTQLRSSEAVLDTLVSNFRVITLDRALARAAGVLRAEYRKATPDTIIAATAIKHELVLVTRNVKDFKRMSKAGFEIMKPY